MKPRRRRAGGLLTFPIAGFVVVLLAAASVSSVVLTRRLLAEGPLGPPPPGVRVWVADATQKIGREAGPGAPTSFSGLAARRSVAQFQIVVTAGRSPVQVDAVRVSRLAGLDADGRRVLLPRRAVSVYFEAFINVYRPSAYESVTRPVSGAYPDALPPLTAPFALEPGKSQPLWIQLEVSEKAVPGDYQGQVTVEFREHGGAMVPVRLRVLEPALPRRPGLDNRTALSLGALWDPRIAGRRPTNGEFARTASRYQSFLLRRGLMPAGGAFELYALPAYGGARGVTDFSSWDEYVDRLVADGAVSVDVPWRLNWPVDAGRGGARIASKRYRAATARYFRELGRHIKGRSKWAGVRFYVDIDGLDAVPTSAARRRLATLVRLVRGNAPSLAIQTGAGARDLVSSADPRRRRGAKGPTDFILQQEQLAARDAAGLGSDWVDPERAFVEESAMHAYKRGSRLPWGGRAERDYEFPSAGGLVNPALFPRVLPWLAFHYRIDGVRFWDAMYWFRRQGSKERTIDPWSEDPAFLVTGPDGKTYRIQNGDGCFLYPGGLTSAHTGQADTDGPISSIRLELFRRGLQDFACLAMLRDWVRRAPDGPARWEGEGALKEAGALVRGVTDFDRDYRKYDRAIDRAMRAIEALQK